MCSSSSFLLLLSFTRSSASFPHALPFLFLVSFFPSPSMLFSLSFFSPSSSLFPSSCRFQVNPGAPIYRSTINAFLYGSSFLFSVLLCLLASFVLGLSLLPSSFRLHSHSFLLSRSSFPHLLSSQVSSQPRRPHISLNNQRIHHHWKERGASWSICRLESCDHRFGSQLGTVLFLVSLGKHCCVIIVSVWLCYWQCLVALLSVSGCVIVSVWLSNRQ